MIKRYSIITAIFIPTLVVLLANIKSAWYGCFNGYDFGIYHQALIEIGYQIHLNPYVTVRGIPILADHFDPIIWLAAAFVRVFDYSYQASMIFEYMTFLLAFFLLVKLRKSSWKAAILLAFTFVFSKGLVSALGSPIHASFWSLPVWVLFVYSIHIRNAKLILISSIFLTIFKESYPIAIAWCSLALFLLKEYRLGLAVLVPGVVGLLNAFVFRPLLIGKIFGHGNQFIDNLFEAPISYTLSTMTQFDWLSFLRLLAPLGLLFFFLQRSGYKPVKSSWLICGFVLFPLFAIQFFAKSMNFHYAFPFIITPLSLMWFEGAFEKAPDKKYILPTLLAIFIFSSTSWYKKSFRTLFFDVNSKCHINKLKDQNTRALLSAIDGIGLEEKIASTGGIIPVILRPGMQLFHMHSHGEIQDYYSILLIEKNEGGDTYTLSPDRVEKIWKACSIFTKDVLLENHYFYLARGVYPSSCIYEN